MRYPLVVVVVLLGHLCRHVHGFVGIAPQGRRGIIRLRCLESLDDQKITKLPRLLLRTGALRLVENGVVQLTDEQSHYVTKVMRLGGKRRSKSFLRVFNGVDGEWLAGLEVLQDGGASGRRNRRVAVQARCIRQLRPQEAEEEGPWLFFAPIKKPRVKLLLEKGTELGASRFVPVITDRTDAGSMRDCSGEKNLDKLASQIVEASEQCERLTVPKLATQLHDVPGDDDDDDVLHTVSVADLLQQWQDMDERHLLICRERSAETSLPVLDQLRSRQAKSTTATTASLRVGFLVGPEGGWSMEEESLMDEISRVSDLVHCVSLGSLVLRAETAAMVALSAFSLHADSTPAQDLN